MKSYKEFNKCCIGASDIAALVLVGCSEEGELKAEFLHFGQDATYSAYLVEGEAEIGDHYQKVAEFAYWMKIYDDDELVADFNGKRIVVYRAAMMGCIIQIFR